MNNPVSTILGQTKSTGTIDTFWEKEFSFLRSKKQSAPMETQDFAHPSAFGCGVLDKDIDSLVEYLDDTLKDIDFSPVYSVDLIYSSTIPREKDIIDIYDLRPLWGQNMNESLIVLENVRLSKDMVKLMSKDKKPTIKIELKNGISCIKFKATEEEYNKLVDKNFECTIITLIGKANVNKYYNKATPQIIIEDYEIKDQEKYYF